jgi:hypothetical protein
MIQTIVLVVLLGIIAWPQYLTGFNTTLGKVLWVIFIVVLNKRNEVLAMLAVLAFIRILALQQKFTPTVYPLVAPSTFSVDSNKVPVWKMSTMQPVVNDDPYFSVVSNKSQM